MYLYTEPNRVGLVAVDFCCEHMVDFLANGTLMLPTAKIYGKVRIKGSDGGNFQVCPWCGKEILWIERKP